MNSARRLPKEIKHVRKLVAGDPASGICHREQNLSVVRRSLHSDFSAGLCELARIAAEILEHLEKAMTVRPDGRKIGLAFQSNLDRGKRRNPLLRLLRC